MNLGVASQTPEARIVLTAENDDTPSVFHVLHTFDPTINPNTPFDDEFELTIPTVVEGVYYILLQLDYDDLLAEDDESNNEAFWNQQVYVDSDWGGCAECATGPSPAAAWAPALALAVLVHRRRRR